MQLHITGHRLHTGPVYLTRNLEHNSTSPSDHQDHDQPPSLTTPPSSTGHHTRTIVTVGVEGYAIQHYNTEQGWPCALHAEGSSFTMLFVLLMWSIIFTSGVPNVFRTKFQASGFVSISYSLRHCVHVLYWQQHMILIMPAVKLPNVAVNKWFFYRVDPWTYIALVSMKTERHLSMRDLLRLIRPVVR